MELTRKLVIVTLLITLFAILFVGNMNAADVIDSKVQLYYFYSDKCAGCKIQTPIIRILKTRGFNFEILKKSEETQAKFDEFKVKVYPTIIIVTPNETIRLEGFQPLRKLIKVLIDVKDSKNKTEAIPARNEQPGMAYYGVHDDLWQLARDVAQLRGYVFVDMQNDCPLIKKYFVTVRPTLLFSKSSYHIEKIEGREAIEYNLRKFYNFN